MTDLGTEFAVEVSSDAETRVHVLEGVVETQSLDRRGASRGVETVTAGHAVCVLPQKGGCKAAEFSPTAFVRSMSAPLDSPAEKAYMAAVLADEPLGYWPLNEPSRVLKFRDRTGHGRGGAAMYKVTCERPGPFADDASAVTLDGDGYIDLGRHDEFALVNNFTVEVWVRIGQVRPYGWVISAADEERTLGWGLGACRLDPDRDNACGVNLSFTTWCVKDYRITIPDDEASEDRWLYWVVAYDQDNTAHFYLNGRHRESVAGSAPGRSGPVWVAIGCETPSSRGWRGRLAHLAVYPRVLNEQQIQNHYQQGSSSTVASDG